jgi:chromate reductase
MNLLQHNAFRKTIIWSTLYYRALSSLSSSSASALKVAVITGSTRTSGPPVINGPRVASFITNELKQRGNVVTLIDPGEFPMMEKPEFSYSKNDVPKKLEHFKNILVDADAYICITPEYNHAPSPGLVNVLNHFGSSVFSFKPSAIVSYSGGQWGGTRAAGALRPILSELGALPGKFKLLFFEYLTLLKLFLFPNTFAKSFPNNTCIVVSAMIHIPNTQVRINQNCFYLLRIRFRELRERSYIFADLRRKQDNFDDHGNPIQDSKRWQDYCDRCFSQLEWWAEAAKEHKMVTDPFARSKPFQSSPSQRNAPSET